MIELNESVSDGPTCWQDLLSEEKLCRTDSSSTSTRMTRTW